MCSTLKSWCSYRNLFSFTSFILVSACAHTPMLSQADRDAYLEQFIGLSSERIYANLDLGKLGYTQTSEPKLTPSELIYIVQRPVTIPLSVAQFPLSGSGTVPIPITTTTSQGYDAHLECQIRFQLKNNIAESLKYSGRTC